MVGAMKIKRELIPIQKIISVACRDFMAFRGLHNFEFQDGINTIVGGSASGKTSLITVMIQCLSTERSRHWTKVWNPYISEKPSLLEMRFIADDKMHYIRRVMENDNTTDLHLYIGEGKNRLFYRDGEVIEYLGKLKPVFVVDHLEAQRSDFFYWTRGKTAQINPMFTKSKHLIERLNSHLPLINNSISNIEIEGRDVYCRYKDGSKVHLAALSLGNTKLIFVLGKLFNILTRIEEDDLSKVILIDEIEMGFDRSTLKKMNEVFNKLAEDYDCQFMITSRFRNGRRNPIRLNRTRVPKYYNLDLNNSQKRKYIFKNPPFTTKTISSWGSSKWKP